MNAPTTTLFDRPHRSRVPALWFWVFALLSVSTLLFAFQRVVHTAVDKAQADRNHQSDQAQAVSQCNRLTARAERRACAAEATGASRSVRLPDVVVSSTSQ